MSISLEPNKGLRMKLDRFSPIHSWHGGGNFWSHEFQLTVRQGALAAFLPRAVEEDGSVLYELRVGGVELTSTSVAIQSLSEIPQQQLHALREALNELKRKAEDPHCDRTKRQLIEGFRLPDPQTERDLYRISGKGSDKKLIVLWGLEREEGSALDPLTAVDLMHAPAPAEPEGEPRKKSLLLPLIAGTCLAAAAGGGWYFFQSEKAAPQNSATAGAPGTDQMQSPVEKSAEAVKAGGAPSGAATKTPSTAANAEDKSRQTADKNLLGSGSSSTDKAQSSPLPNPSPAKEPATGGTLAAAGTLKNLPVETGSGSGVSGQTVSGGTLAKQGTLVSAGSALSSGTSQAPAVAASGVSQLAVQKSGTLTTTGSSSGTGLNTGTAGSVGAAGAGTYASTGTVAKSGSVASGGTGAATGTATNSGTVTKTGTLSTAGTVSSSGTSAGTGSPAGGGTVASAGTTAVTNFAKNKQVISTGQGGTNRVSNGSLVSSGTVASSKGPEPAPGAPQPAAGAVSPQAPVATVMTPNGPPPSGISSLTIVSTSLSGVLPNGTVEVLLNIVARNHSGAVSDAPPIDEWRVDGDVQKKPDGTQAQGPVLPVKLSVGKHNITTIGRGADGKPYRTDAEVSIRPKE